MSNPGPRWFEQRKDFVTKPRPIEAATETPDMLTRCPSCNEPVFNEQLAANLEVCPGCDHHFRMDAMARLQMLCDPDTMVMHDQHLGSVDTLGFVDSKPYPVRIAASKKKTGRTDAFLSCSAEMGGIPLEIGCFDFTFMGGSMGSVVGERITRLFERALKNRRPAIVISASGGARMQEGVLSLMQMAKTCSALARLQDAGFPYISILVDPTTGGVAASFSMLGDLNISEPRAMIGFAGARVIEQTIGTTLPEGFQTAEYLLDHGMIDAIVSRDQMRGTLIRLLRQFLGEPSIEADDPLISRSEAAANLHKPAGAEIA